MMRIRALQAALERSHVGEIRMEERLAAYTSLKVGGRCRALVRPPDLASLRRLVDTLGEMGVPYMPMGGGSNMLISDEGFDGVVVLTDALQGWEEPEPGYLRLGAGVATARVVRWAARRDMSGMEGLTGVPGSIGGAAVMNAGGRGGDIRDALERVTVVTPPPEVHTVEVEAEALGLAYRSSSLPRGSIIGAVELRLHPAAEEGAAARRMEELLQHRMATQPAGVLSVGSVFKNPEGDAAGRLIESCGLKSASEGPVEISSLHANYLVNTGGATAAQVRRLIDRVQRIVEERTGVGLEREVVTVGFDADPLPPRVWVPAGHPMADRRRSERGFGSRGEGDS
ncbi:MAG: UDP-N-acetylmuramate dehydrogenase [bacterium]